MQRPVPNVQRPSPNVQRPMPNYGSGRPGSNRPGYNRPGNRPGNRPDNRPDNRPGINRPDYNRPGGNNRPDYNRPGGNIISGNTVIVNRPNRYPTYPVYRPPGGGYYRPPNGGYYRPPRPPYGGWHGGYFPPPRYYYNDGPSVGGILFGVAVTTSLLALLSASNQPDTVYIQGSPPPPPYQPPSNAKGIPASINVDLNGMSAAARPSASTCLTEAARQIGATGGTEIRIDKLVDIEQGNGGYRFRLDLTAVYPDQTRLVPMYCRATPEKIVELTFG
ncbi:MAG: hypothetical protein DCF31_17960 [Alphaproteobacteria bacterium]|nr:MAG: hypothetical protein DCF31_17960 [Alphaproteobacteria bacterium]